MELFPAIVIIIINCYSHKPKNSYSSYSFFCGVICNLIRTYFRNLKKSQWTMPRKLASEKRNFVYFSPFIVIMCSVLFSQLVTQSYGFYL